MSHIDHISHIVKASSGSIREEELVSNIPVGFAAGNAQNPMQLFTSNIQQDWLINLIPSLGLEERIGGHVADLGQRSPEGLWMLDLVELAKPILSRQWKIDPARYEVEISENGDGRGRRLEVVVQPLMLFDAIHGSQLLNGSRLLRHLEKGGTLI